MNGLSIVLNLTALVFSIHLGELPLTHIISLFYLAGMFLDEFPIDSEVSQREFKLCPAYSMFQNN